MPITESDYPETEDTTPSETSDTESTDTEDESEESTSSALLPKSLAGESVKVGDTITLKVEKIMEDEIQVCPSKEKSEDDSEEMDMAESNSKLDMMAM